MSDKNEGEKPAGNEVKQMAVNKIMYDVSKEYWANQPPTVNGMLGGFDFVSDADIDQSQKFLNSFLTVIFIVFYKRKRIIEKVNILVYFCCC